MNGESKKKTEIIRGTVPTFKEKRHWRFPHFVTFDYVTGSGLKNLSVLLLLIREKKSELLLVISS